MTIKQDIQAGLALLPGKMNTPRSMVQLCATNLQENPNRYVQQVNGPARGDYQFEEGGGVLGVMTHPASKSIAQDVCEARGVPFDKHSVYMAIGADHVLAAALARLLYWTSPLPMATNAEDAWGLYLSVWRPGAFKREGEKLRQKFLANYARAERELA